MFFFNTVPNFFEQNLEINSLKALLNFNLSAKRCPPSFSDQIFQLFNFLSLSESLRGSRLHKFVKAVHPLLLWGIYTTFAILTILFHKLELLQIFE